jgi:hypothetical protein
LRQPKLIVQGETKEREREGQVKRVSGRHTESDAYGKSIQKRKVEVREERLRETETERGRERE